MLVALAVPILAIAASGIGMLQLQGDERAAVRAIQDAVSVRQMAEETAMALQRGEGAALRYAAVGGTDARSALARDFASALRRSARLSQAPHLDPSARREAQEVHTAATALSAATATLSAGHFSLARFNAAEGAPLAFAVSNLDAIIAAEDDAIGLADARDAWVQSADAWLLSMTVVVGIGLTLLLGWLLLRDLSRRLSVLSRRAGALVTSEPEVGATQRARDQIEEISQVLDGAGEVLARRMATQRQATLLLERLIVRSPLVFFAWDLESGRPVFVSSNLYDVLGYQPQEIQDVRSFWRRVTHPDDLSIQEARLTSLAERGQGEAEFRARRRDGRFVWLRTVGLLDEYEGVRRVLAYSLDIDAQHRMEEGLVEAREAAERANREKSGFLSRISHELRTPLNAILGFAQLLSMSDLSLEDQESVAFIEQGGRHLLALVNDFLDVTRIESGRLQLSLESVPLGAAVEATLPLVAHEAEERGVAFASDGDPGCAVLADRQRLRQVLLNLLSNAIKYNRRGGHVHISWRAEAGSVLLAVEDTGRGIPEDQVDLLFTPFERLGAEETGEQGSGLGLVAVKRLVEAMGGEVAVRSQVGVGSTFEVRLPMAQPEGGTDPAPADSRRDPSGNERAVLYIDDNPQSAQLVQRTLSGLGQVYVEPVFTAEAGLRRAQEGKWALILLDLDLPDASGADLLRVLRSDERTRRIPVLVVSASGEARAQRIAKTEGAAGYITKPLQVTEFVAMCRRLLELEGGGSEDGA